jgi:peptidyl-tRNA hydrolase
VTASDTPAAQPADDAMVMYYVAPSRVEMTAAEAIALAGGLAVACARTLEPLPRWADAFARWRRSSFRKVALRAQPDDLAAVAEAHAHVAARVADGGTVLCLPPLARDQRSQLLASLRPFTDARRPQQPAPAPDASPAMLYVVRAGVMRTTGKAMAQAGHAALMCWYEHGEGAAGSAARAAFDAWCAAGRPGHVRVADDVQWRAISQRPDAVVVTDGGLTQVAPGTETVVALVPGAGAELAERLPPLLHM